MRHFFIITNIHKDEKKLLTKKLKSYIEAKGGICGYYFSNGNKEITEGINPEIIPENTECIFVLGGDGTLIRVAGDLHEKNIPLIGVNLGTLGYLCELEENTVYHAIDEIMLDHFVVEQRMMLEGCCVINGEEQESYQAFNDIIIHRSSQLSVRSMILRVNGRYVNTYTGDGMMVATPTGSTAYNLSAGGPIVDPKTELLLVTPINPHNFNSKSIVLSAKDYIEIEIAARSHEKNEVSEVSFDGVHATQINIGDKVIIRKAENATKILKLNQLSFLEILSKKMQTYI